MREIRTASLCLGAWAALLLCLVSYSCFSRLFRRVVPGTRLHTRPNRQSDIGRHLFMRIVLIWPRCWAWCTCLSRSALPKTAGSAAEKSTNMLAVCRAHRRKQTALNSLACRAWPVCCRVIEPMCGVKLLNASCMTAINAAQNRNDGDLSLPISHGYARQHEAGCHAPLGPIINIGHCANIVHGKYNMYRMYVVCRDTERHLTSVA